MGQELSASSGTTCKIYTFAGKLFDLKLHCKFLDKNISSVASDLHVFKLWTPIHEWKEKGGLNMNSVGCDRSAKSMVLYSENF